VTQVVDGNWAFTPSSRRASSQGLTRRGVTGALQQSLTDDEINILLGRKQGLEEFEAHIGGDWKVLFSVLQKHARNVIR